MGFHPVARPGKPAENNSVDQSPMTMPARVPIQHATDLPPVLASSMTLLEEMHDIREAHLSTGMKWLRVVECKDLRVVPAL